MRAFSPVSAALLGHATGQVFTLHKSGKFDLLVGQVDERREGESAQVEVGTTDAESHAIGKAWLPELT
jgi:hypothetical protein